MLTPLYDRWLAVVLPQGLPVEPHATCEQCAMCSTVKADADQSFRADVKCCTYLPWLPNFSVGGVLSDEGPGSREAQESVRRRMGDQRWVTPLGLARRPTARHLGELGGQGSFGREKSLLCPHFNDEASGSCSIWRHRNSVCATWYCKHARGRVGQSFWNALKGLLGTAEEHVSVWCALELGISPMAISRAQEVERVPVVAQVANELAAPAEDLQDLQDIWGDWMGRPEEYYRACAEAATRLSWPDIVSAGGISILVKVANVQAAYAAVNSPLEPDSPIFLGVAAYPASGGLSRLATYSPYDPLLVPSILPYFLTAFDGRPFREVAAQIYRDHEMDIDLELVRRLIDFGVLSGGPKPHLLADAESAPQGEAVASSSPQ